jgi:hypothetical protein
MGPSGRYSGGSENSAMTKKQANKHNTRNKQATSTNTTQETNKQQAQTHQANMHKHINRETYVTLFGTMSGLW